jgi:hypothetical protein
LALAEILGKAKKATMKAVCDVAEEMGVPEIGRPKDGADKSDNCQTSKKGGNDQVYLARRILAADPETFERLRRGEFRSVRAAGCRI